MKLSLTAALLALAIAAPTASAVTKGQRALLVVSNLADQGVPKYNWLYQFLDASSVSLAQLMMSPHYARTQILAGSNASSAKFVNALTEAAKDNRNLAVDTFVHLHGSSGTLWFSDGAKSTETLGATLASKNIGGRLRLLYSTACYGSTHAQHFVNGGFKVASGALKVNANSSYEYPVIMTQWGMNQKYKTAVDAGNNAAARAMHDNAAKAAGFADANSFKTIRGNSSTRITSSAL